MVHLGRSKQGNMTQVMWIAITETGGAVRIRKKAKLLSKVLKIFLLQSLHKHLNFILRLSESIHKSIFIITANKQQSIQNCTLLVEGMVYLSIFYTIETYSLSLTETSFCVSLSVCVGVCMCGYRERAIKRILKM